MKKGVMVFLALLPSLWLYAKPHHFDEAKKVAYEIWLKHPETFYCGCQYDKFGTVDTDSCQFNFTQDDYHIGWEHVVPVSWYGRQLTCWKEPLCVSKKGKAYGGRKCCQQIDKEFREMEADLYNLVPVIREINRARSDFQFGEFFYDKNKGQITYRGCPLIIDERYHSVEPRDEVKGMIARIHLYMTEQYDIPLSEQQQRLMQEWNKRFPPSEWEKSWSQEVALIQGNENKYIVQYNEQKVVKS